MQGHNVLSGALKRRAHQGGIAERRQMIDRSHKLSVSRQASLLGISRGAVYYLPKPIGESDLRIMHAMDRLHLDFPFMGSRQLTRAQRWTGFVRQRAGKDN